MTDYTSPDIHVYIDSPTVVFKARVNLPSGASYPLTVIPFDTVTVGAYTDVSPDAFFVIGSADGLDDRGRGRVQNVLSSTEIPVGRVSRGTHDGEFDIYDGDYVTIYDDYRVHAKLPWQDPNGTDFKDQTVPVGDFMENPPPVSNCGPGTAGTVDAGTGLFTVTFPAAGVNQSYAVAEGATIVSHDWDVGGGTITVGTSSSAVITATFPPGKYWVAHTVVDSNGKPHTSRCRVIAIDPDDDPTIQSAIIESLRMSLQGTALRLRIPEDLPRSVYPDGALVMVWIGEPSGPTDRSHMKFYGWHQSDDVSGRASKQGWVRDTAWECVDANGRLDTLPGFPQALERGDDAYWDHAPNLDMFFAHHYLGFWHSTAWGLADVLVPDELRDYESMRLDSAGSSLYDQLESRVVSMVPDYHFVCNSQGQLSVLPDWRLMDVGDRPTVAGILTESDWTDMRFTYKRPPDVYARRASAVVCSTNWIMLGGKETLPLAFCIAPGEKAFGQGVAEAVTAEKLTPSQAALNVCEGHRYALDNARFGAVTVKLLDPTTIWDYEPALMGRYQINIPAEIAAQRGLPFTQTHFMARELNVRFVTDKTGTWLDAELTLEFETAGFPAATHIPEAEGTPDDYETPAPPPPTEPPGGGLEGGVELVAAIGVDGKVYRTFDFQTPSGSGGPTWEEHETGITEVPFSWVVNPFCPGYIDGVGPVGGWLATETSIYYIDDLFGTVTVEEVCTFDVTANASQFHWRTIQASFGAYFAPGANPWLVCVSNYGDTSDHEGTWARVSTDGGATFGEEVQISSSYDANAADRFNPIGLYASPKTPGLAYTIAHVASGGTGPAPRFGIWPDGGSLSVVGPGGSVSGIYIAEEFGPTTGTGPGGSTLVGGNLIIAPPANTYKLTARIRWSAANVEEGVSSGVAAGLQVLNPPGVSRTGSSNFNHADNSTTSGSFTCVWTQPVSANNWPVNSTSIITTPPAGPGGARVNATANVNAIGIGNEASMKLRVSITVIEIELHDGTIYNPSETEALLVESTDWGESWTPVIMPAIEPGAAYAGTLHFPWPNNADEQLAYHGYFDDSTNRQFRLMRVQGGTITDVSPNDGSINYGVNRGHFGVRTFDSNRQYVLAAVIGNDTSDNPADDMHALFISDDEGATWAEVIAPFADSGAPANRPALEAAFGGDSEQVIFIWGPPDYMGYSDDFGATVDDRSGDLSGSGGFIGIAGGPPA